MHETVIPVLTLVLAWVAGGVLGAIFFGGLWWTVRKGVASTQPALWFFSSLLLRMSISLAGFYFVSGGHWERLLLCLLGFVMARLVVTWLTRLTKPTQSSGESQHCTTSHSTTTEVRHAP